MQWLQPVTDKGGVKSNRLYSEQKKGIMRDYAALKFRLLTLLSSDSSACDMINYPLFERDAEDHPEAGWNNPEPEDIAEYRHKQLSAKWFGRAIDYLEFFHIANPVIYHINLYIV